MTTEERKRKVEKDFASAKRRVGQICVAGAVASVLILSLASCGRSENKALLEENTALREKVAALEKALEVQRQELAQTNKASVRSPAQASELEGKDLLAWKLAYGSAVGSFYPGVFPSRPIRSLMTKNDNGYVFIFSNLNELAQSAEGGPPWSVHTIWKVVVMEIGDTLRVVSSRAGEVPDYDKLFGAYITSPSGGKAVGH